MIIFFISISLLALYFNSIYLNYINLYINLKPNVLKSSVIIPVMVPFNGISFPSASIPLTPEKLVVIFKVSMSIFH